jgi:hypothetical protein
MCVHDDVIAMRMTGLHEEGKSPYDAYHTVVGDIHYHLGHAYIRSDLNQQHRDYALAEADHCIERYEMVQQITISEAFDTLVDVILYFR